MGLRYRKPLRWLVILLAATTVFVAAVGMCLVFGNSEQQVEQLWSQPAYGYLDPVLLAGDRIIVGSRIYGGLTAYSKEGQELWEYRFSGPAIRFVPMADSLVAQAFQVRGSIGERDTIDFNGNALTCTRIAIEDAMRVGCWSDGLLVYFDNSDYIRAVDTGFNELWSFPLPGARVHNLAIGPEGRTYFGLSPAPGDPCLYFCLDQAGNLLWKYDTVAEAEAPPVFGGGKVFVGTRQGLYAFDDKGTVCWQVLRDQFTAIHLSYPTTG